MARLLRRTVTLCRGAAQVGLCQAGQDLVEYALIIALVALLIVGTLVALRGGIQQPLTSVTSTLAGTPIAGQGGPLWFGPTPTPTPER